MPMQYRRKESRSGHRDAMYTPERDIAYLGPPIMIQACEALDEQWWEPWFQQYCRDTGVTAEDIAAGMPMLAAACHQVVQVANPVPALEESGFAALPPAVQMAFYAKMGQCFLANVWSGIKDISSPESDPPATIETLLGMSDAVMRHFAALGRARAAPISGGQVPPSVEEEIQD